MCERIDMLRKTIKKSCNQQTPLSLCVYLPVEKKLPKPSIDEASFDLQESPLLD